MKMTEKLTGKVALITGAAGGIGSATAKLFAQNGARLSLFDKEESSLLSVAQECDKISSINAKSFTFSGDITDEKICHDVVEETVKLFGKIDILVNCAGIVKGANVDEYELDVFDEVMAVNIRALVAITSLAIPYLKKSQGNIVSLSSAAGHRTFNTFAAYGISKAGVIAYTKFAAAELAKFKIRVNCISPGYIDTPLLYDPQISAEANVKRLQEFAEKHPIGRMGQPEDIANSVLYLASDVTSSFITGTDLVIDGGLLIRN